jgi:hypothetical protein
MKKRRKSKAGQGPPPPGHYHAIAGRRSFVPHASDATNITPSRLLPASTTTRARRLCSTPNPPPRRARPPLLPPLDPARSRSERQWTPHEEGGRTAGHTPVGKEADGARSRRRHENSTAFSTSCSVPPCSHRLWGPEEASARRPQGGGRRIHADRPPHAGRRGGGHRIRVGGPSRADRRGRRRRPPRQPSGAEEAHCAGSGGGHAGVDHTEADHEDLAVVVFRARGSRSRVRERGRCCGAGG